MVLKTIYGLDTSRWQGTITQTEINAAKAFGKKFWYIKGSGGDDGLYIDSQFNHTLGLLRANKWHIGAYHFSSPPGHNLNPKIEAEFAVKNVWSHLTTGEVAILDIDTFGVTDPMQAKAILDVATPMLGFKPLLYMNQETENNLDWSPLVKENYGLIIANYVISPSGTVTLKHWPFYLGQQYSSNGTIGSMHPVDLDAIFVTDISVWDKYGKPAPKPVAGTVIEPESKVKPVQVKVQAPVQVVNDPLPPAVQTAATQPSKSIQTPEVVQTTTPLPKTVSMASDNVSQPQNESIVIKPGYKTTEFGLTTVSSVATFVEGFVRNHQLAIKVAAVLAIAVIVAVYIWSRTHVKRAALSS